MISPTSTYRPYVGAWYNDDGVSKPVKDMIRRFRPNMRVVKLPSGQYGVCTSVLVLHNAWGNVGALLREWVPNLYVPQAEFPDPRWIRVMLENPMKGSGERVLERMRQEREQFFKQVDEMAEADAKEAYPAFRELNKWNMSNVGVRNPYDDVKRKQDRLGKEQK